MDPEIDWQAVAESERSCIWCEHSRSAHDNKGSQRCLWRYFNWFRKCRCKEYNGGNIWPRICILPGESVEFQIDLAAR